MFDRDTFLRLNIVKTINELLKLIDDKIKNKKDDYVVDFRKKLIEMQNNMKNAE